jgi:hypothetical protein
MRSTVVLTAVSLSQAGLTEEEAAEETEETEETEKTEKTDSHGGTEKRRIEFSSLRYSAPPCESVLSAISVSTRFYFERI